MADVFVSYDRRDRDLAEKVVAALTEEGLTVWWDDRITPHETWDKTIEREVDNAKKVLVLWTKHSVESDWVRTEAGAAKEATPPKLIQARFSDCKVPLAFRLLQHVDLIGWTPKRRHSGWDRLTMWLKDGLDRPAVPAPGAGGPIPVEALEGDEEVAIAQAESIPESPPYGGGPSVETAPEEPVAVAQAPASSTPMGLGDFSDLAGSTDVAGTPPTAEASSAPPSGEPGGVKVSMPKIDMPKIGGGSGIDKRLLVGGAVALGAVVVIGLGMMVLPALFNGGGGGFSGDERTTMGGYLNGYADRYAQGLEAVGDDELAWLANEAAHTYEVRLEAGQSYRVLGACDTNCRDVDLYVNDPSGNEIGRDILTDDFPVVEIPSAQGGTYSIRIGMPNCTSDRCLSAARLYEVN